MIGTSHEFDSSPRGVAAGPAQDAIVAGRYRLVREVGSGGMGVVWEAVNTWTDRRVALKFMARGAEPGLRSTAPAEYVDRFLREAKATARVRHPNVVDVLDMGHDPERGGLFIVYEFLDGEPLRALLERRGRLDAGEASALLVPAMEGVAEAHRCGVVHRDLKPENVFLARGAGGAVVPRVIDFGVARLDAPGADEPSLTRSGVALGTAHYMSPEQARGAAGVDARSDVWAMGALWFEALAGRVPFEGGGYNEVLAKILTEAPPSLAAARPDVPAPLAAAVDRALARDPAARHATMAAFLDAVRAALADDVPPPAPPTIPPPRASRRAPLVAAAVAGLLALGLATLATTKRPRATTPAVAPEAPRATTVTAPPPARVDPAPPPAAAPSRPEPAPPATRVVQPPAARARVTARRPEPPRRPPASAPPNVAPGVNGAPVLDP